MYQKDYKKRFGTFSNAYAKYDKSGFPPYTCFVKDFQGCLDHILFNNKIKCSAVLETPSKEEFTAENGAIPSSKFPSDHIRI
jgi:mRNA deadenylase 3'-5' endonuclease subunit Ccr4